MALAVTSTPFQQVDMPAIDLRRYLATVVAAEGLAVSTDLQVAQNGTPNMSVNISAGSALVKGDTVAGQGYYLAYNDAVYNLAGFTAAHATLPRVDRVVIRVRDAFHGDAANDESFQILAGTPTSGATLANLTGAAAVGNSQLLLANVLIPAAATTVTTANIGNVAAVLTTAGAALPLRVVVDGTIALAAGAYADLATPVSVTVPYTGNFYVRWGFRSVSAAGFDNRDTCWLTPKYGAAATADADGLALGQTTAQSGISGGSVEGPSKALTVGDVVKLQGRYTSGGGGAPTLRGVFLVLLPA